MTKPFSPKEAADAHVTNIPSEIINIVNKLLAETFTGTGSVIIRQYEITDAYIAKYPDEKCDYKWLDFEPLYRGQGWDVEYDKPGYGDDFDAYFKFTPK